MDSLLETFFKQPSASLIICLEIRFIYFQCSVLRLNVIIHLIQLLPLRWVTHYNEFRFIPTVPSNIYTTDLYTKNLHSSCLCSDECSLWAEDTVT